METIRPEIAALKGQLQVAWNSSDYGKLAAFLEPGAEEFVARLGIQRGEHVLDVGCGSGNIAIPAARRGAVVTGLDIAPRLLATARERARAERLVVDFNEGDAEALPYPEATFDTVVSMFGAMFAPRPARVVSELIRVTCAGGRLALANWTPDSLMGKMFQLIAQYVPPSPLLPVPALWGDEAIVRDRFGDRVSNLRLTRRMYTLQFPFGVARVVELICRYDGSTQLALTGLDSEKHQALRRDLEQYWFDHNTARDGTTSVEAEYLDMIATRHA